jgi:hypothetical protein
MCSIKIIFEVSFLYKEYEILCIVFIGGLVVKMEHIKISANGINA